MKLKKLLKNLPVEVIKGSKEIEITGICSNSKFISPGNLYVAKQGRKYHGSKFIAEAAASGAIAVLTDIYDPFLEDVTQIIAENPAMIELELAKTFYKEPDKKLFLVGITGTNGKTTLSYLVKHFLDSLERPCGLIGTIGVIINENQFPSNLTTPDVSTNYKYLHDMAASGCLSAVMEASSIAIEQKRLGFLDFDIGIFTNLSPEHLDYHQTMENYALAKAAFFSKLGKSKKKSVVIANIDDPWYENIVSGTSAKILTYSLNKSADLVAKNIVLGSRSTEFLVEYRGESCAFSTNLIGRFNVYNCLAVIALGVYLKIPLSELAKILAFFNGVRGRLEHVLNRKNLNIFVDYAHTPDALKNVLETLNELKKNRIITVFGCGGDRDRIKRAPMGSIVEKMSDIAIVTSDNPRTEDPNAIIKEIVSACPTNDKVFIEIDRKKAIKMAVEMAKKDDIVLIAGKGHETYQIFGERRISFDDRLVAKELCEEL